MFISSTPKLRDFVRNTPVFRGDMVFDDVKRRCILQFLLQNMISVVRIDQDRRPERKDKRLVLDNQACNKIFNLLSSTLKSPC